MFYCLLFGWHTGFVRVRELAAYLQAPFEGNGERELHQVAVFEDAEAEDLSFVTPELLRKTRSLKLAASSPAGCLLVPPDFENADHRTVIRTPNPRAAMARAIRKLHPPAEPVPGIHPSAILGPGAIVAPGAHIGPFVSVGAGARVGAGTSIGAGATRLTGSTPRI